jgi:hypothetical protein
MSKVKLAVVGLAVAAISATGVGAAFAATPAHSKAPVTAPAKTTSTADTDNVQQGDQTGVDSAASGTETAAPETVAPETAAAETSATSDGPGGHQDPAGNVDYQSEANN